MYIQGNIVKVEDGIGIIVLDDGREVLIDPANVTKVAGFRWWAAKSATGKHEYILGYIDGVSKRLVHFLYGEHLKGSHIRHINGNDLDCRRVNVALPADTVCHDEDGPYIAVYHCGNTLRARVSEEDVERLQQYNGRWSATPSGYIFTGSKANGNKGPLYLHRFILDVSDRRIVDHIDGDKLNCRRENLRAVTTKESAANRPTLFATPGKYAKKKNPFYSERDTKPTKISKRRKNSEIIVNGDLAYIQLTQGQQAVIDAEDVDATRSRKWYATWNVDKHAYYATSTLNGKTIYLHRIVMGVLDHDRSIIVDHINGNTLDCRKSNLRLTTMSENMQNRTSGANRNSKTGLRNVFYHKATNRLEVKVMVKGKGYYGGYFPNTEEGRQAAAAKAQELRRELHTHSGD